MLPQDYSYGIHTFQGLHTSTDSLRCARPCSPYSSFFQTDQVQNTSLEGGVKLLLACAVEVSDVVKSHCLQLHWVVLPVARLDGLDGQAHLSCPPCNCLPCWCGKKNVFFSGCYNNLLLSCLMHATGASGHTCKEVCCANICPRCCFFSFLSAEISRMVQLRASEAVFHF